MGAHVTGDDLARTALRTARDWAQRSRANGLTDTDVFSRGVATGMLSAAIRLGTDPLLVESVRNEAWFLAGPYLAERRP
jgi:hypothetical protein